MRGLVCGLAIAVLVVACATSRAPTDLDWRRRQQKMNEVIALWVQIRDWRREARMELDPSPADLLQWRGGTVTDAARACPVGHRVPETCSEVCILGDHICDNAEAICGIADELGKSDPAQEKCASAKASCREAKRRCCTCSERASAEEAP
ncbi:MAG: hypothetical protein ACTHU0_22500 [Kofleriaceae bacterium]